MDSSDLSDGPITLQEYLEVKKALASSEAKVQQLMKVNNNLSEELRRLQKEVHMTSPHTHTHTHTHTSSPCILHSLPKTHIHTHTLIEKSIE